MDGDVQFQQGSDGRRRQCGPAVAHDEQAAAIHLPAADFAHQARLLEAAPRGVAQAQPPRKGGLFAFGQVGGRGVR
jgi:hypothetical protein